MHSCLTICSLDKVNLPFYLLFFLKYQPYTAKAKFMFKKRDREREREFIPE